MKKQLKTRVSRDPVHGEITLSPMEVLCTDTRAVQRLREISQLGGAERVYPGATHTRFLHSLGVMHIAGMYAEHLGFPLKRMRVLRLAGLLHDIGHGPFSHQFDDVVYKRAGIKGGHDEQRERILLELMPGELIKIYEENLKTDWQENIISELKQVLGEEFVESNPLEVSFTGVMKLVCELFEGEKTGDADFNIVQGPLGADRTDFVLRDAYYCGTPEYGTIDLQRIVRSSRIVVRDDRERLTYGSKIIDGIYRVLFGRFMMYKNVYFHKTARAADLMLQRVLDLSYEALDMEERVADPERFLEMTEDWVYYTLKYMIEYGRDTEESGKIREAFELLNDYRERHLWKSVMEHSFSVTGMDPTKIAASVGEDTITGIVQQLKRLIESGAISDNDLEVMREIIKAPYRFFKVDTPYKLTLAHPAEFLVNEVYLRNTRNPEDLIDFETFLKKNPFYQSVSGQLVQIVRIYMTKDKRDLLKKYRLQDMKNDIEITTRW